MKPWFAAPLAGLFALPAWSVGAFLGGLAHWAVMVAHGIVHFLLGWGWVAGLARPVEGLVILAVPAAVAGGVYAFIAHGADGPWFGGLAGVLAGALVFAAALLFGLAGTAAALAPLLLGFLGASAGTLVGRGGTATPGGRDV